MQSTTPETKAPRKPVEKGSGKGNNGGRWKSNVNLVQGQLQLEKL